MALKNSQNVYFHSKTQGAVTRSGDDWTQVQLKHKIGQIGIDYHTFCRDYLKQILAEIELHQICEFSESLGLHQADFAILDEDFLQVRDFQLK